MIYLSHYFEFLQDWLAPVSLFALVSLHFLADYAWQGDFMAKAKNPAQPIPGVPWGWVMWAHAFIHGFFVLLVTGFWSIALLEVAAHYIIDVNKCKGRLTFGQDQVLHIICKCVWCLMAWFLETRIGA